MHLRGTVKVADPHNRKVPDEYLGLLYMEPGQMDRFGLLEAWNISGFHAIDQVSLNALLNQFQ